MLALFDIVLILFVAKVATEVIGRFDVSPVVAELLTGIVLGPFILGVVLPSEQFDILAELGLLMMMLYVGLTSKMSDIAAHRKAATIIGSLGVVVSFAMGGAVCYAFGFGLVPSLFLGILLSNTSIEVVSGIVIREETHGTGSLLVASALADDFIAIYLIGLLSAITTTGTPDMAEMAVITAKILAYLAVTLYVSEKILVKDIFRIIGKRYFRSDYNMLSIMFILTFAFAILANIFGLHEIIGAYLAGLVIGRLRERRDPLLNVRIIINENIEHLGVYLKSIFMPFFFIHIGLSFNPLGSLNWAFIGAVSIAAFAGKILGCGAGALAVSLGRAKAALVGIGMCGRGSLELAMVTYGYTSGVIGEDIFSVIVLVSLLTIVLTPILFKMALSRMPAPVVYLEDGIDAY
ncbi:MAG: cation:proton antiporter [Candidatus Methanofastidiosa archaeon]|nr:cation:proton antiporter [Candidatus Methanofastidiosa archaeon]